MRLATFMTTFGCLLSVRAGDVSGTVYVREGQARHPAAEVRVLARNTERGGPIQIAQTDAAGRYSLQNLPRTRAWLTVVKRGYCARAVSSGDSVLVVDLGTETGVSHADFEILPGGVVTGRVTDQWNEPVEKAGVMLHLASPGKGVDRVEARSAVRCNRLFGGTCTGVGRRNVHLRPSSQVKHCWLSHQWYEFPQPVIPKDKPSPE